MVVHVYVPEIYDFTTFPPCPKKKKNSSRGRLNLSPTVLQKAVKYFLGKDTFRRMILVLLPGLFVD